MALNFTFNPQAYEAQDFQVIPTGDHRVRIADIVEKEFKSGNNGFEITFDVSNYNSKLWFYLVIDPADIKKTNQRLGAFFDSFGITNYDLNTYKSWVGKIGAARVKHEEYNSEMQAKVAFLLARKKQDSLPAWVEKGNSAPTAQAGPTLDISSDNLPF